MESSKQVRYTNTKTLILGITAIVILAASISIFQAETAYGASNDQHRHDHHPYHHYKHNDRGHDSYLDSDALFPVTDVGVGD